MIRVLVCPRCSKKLRLDDSLGMQAGKCPGCGQKFRIPKPKTAAAPPVSAVPPAAVPRREATPLRGGYATPAPTEFRPHVPHSPPRAEFQPPAAAAPPPQLAIPEADILPVDDPHYPAVGVPADGAGYNLAINSGPAPSPDHIPEAQVVDDFYNDVLEETGYGPAGGKRRRKKKRKRQSTGMTLETSNLIISSCVMGGFWILMILILWAKPHAWPIVMAFGAAIFAVGQSWFIRTVMDDGIEVALLCMFVPLYPLIYFIGNMDRLGKQYAIRMCGLLIVITAGIVMLADPKSPDDEEHPAYKPPPVPRFEQPAPPPPPAMPAMPERDERPADPGL